MTQLDLSEALAICKDSVTRWERGVREPSASQLKQISYILDTSIAYLMGETDNPVSSAPITIEGNAEDLYVVRSGTRITIGKKEPSTPPKQASLEDLARARETPLRKV